MVLLHYEMCNWVLSYACVSVSEWVSDRKGFVVSVEMNERVNEWARVSQRARMCDCVPVSDEWVLVVCVCVCVCAHLDRSDLYATPAVSPFRSEKNRWPFIPPFSLSSRHCSSACVSPFPLVRLSPSVALSLRLPFESLLVPPDFIVPPLLPLFCYLSILHLLSLSLCVCAPSLWPFLNRTKCISVSFLPSRLGLFSRHRTRRAWICLSIGSSSLSLSPSSLSLSLSCSSFVLGVWSCDWVLFLHHMMQCDRSNTRSSITALSHTHCHLHIYPLGAKDPTQKATVCLCVCVYVWGGVLCSQCVNCSYK